LEIDALFQVVVNDLWDSQTVSTKMSGKHKEGLVLAAIIIGCSDY